MRSIPPIAAWLAALIPVGALLFGLRGALPTLADGLWGPADPWLNGDFNGGWWLWWALSEGWEARAAAVGWPDGAGALAQVIPNPLDMWLLSRLGPPTALAWNLAQLGHLVAWAAAAWALARAAGASAASAAAGAALAACSPVILHEAAGGRPSNLIVWPGLLALALLVWPGGARGAAPRADARLGWRWWATGIGAGALAALQGVAYAWHGAALILTGLPLVRDPRRAILAGITGSVCVAPYLVWLLSGLGEVPEDLPQVGFTALPLAGVAGLDGVPPRFRLHPLLALAGLVGGIAARRRGGLGWLAAGGIGLLVAIGPRPTWALGEPLGAGPWAWVSWAWSGANRMHHPVRATLLALPLLGVAAALGLDRLRGWRPAAGWLGAAALLGVALANGQAMGEATTWAQPGAPPFADVQIPGEGPVVDLLGLRHRSALSLQSWHGRPIREPLAFRRGHEPLDRALERVARGEAPGPGLWANLRAMGFTHVLVLDRFGDAPEAAAIVEAALGAEVAPGVYAL